MSTDTLVLDGTAEATGAEPAIARGPSRLVRLLPILAFQLYLNASIALFAFGPWVWPLPGSMTRLLVFVLLAHAALLAGYLTAAFREPRGYYGRVPGDTLLRAAIVLTLLLYLPTLMALTGGFADLGLAFSDPAALYMRYQQIEQQDRPTDLITYVRTLCAPILALLLPLVFRYWSSASLRLRLFGAAAVLSNLSLFLFTGRNKGLVDLVLLFPWLYGIYLGLGRVRFRPRRLAFAALIFLLAFAGFTQYYARNTAGRSGPMANPYWIRLFGGLEARPEHVMVRGLSPEMTAAVLGLSFNQTHAYYALSIALEKPYEPTWGLGHSYFLQTLTQRITGHDDARRRSYPGRLEAEDGWSITEFWHTTYSWFASDVTFPGVILLVFLLGRLLALTWLDALRGENPYAMGLLILVATVIYYLPTNNIVFGFPDGFASFWGLLVLWWFTRYRVQLTAAQEVKV